MNWLILLKVFGKEYLPSFSPVGLKLKLIVIRFYIHFFFYLYVGSSEERECGCASISIIGRSPEAADTFIEKKLLRIVAPLMLDENVSVKHAAIGALRNISSIRPDICDQMIQQVKMKSAYLLYH